MQHSSATPHAPTCLQHALEQVSRLRSEAANARGQLQCMSVIITGSSGASVCTFANTAAIGAGARDLQLWPLSEEDSTRTVRNLLQRMGRASQASAWLPDKVLVLIRLLGGNPQLLARALVALSGQDGLSEEMHIAGMCHAFVGCLWHAARGMMRHHSHAQAATECCPQQAMIVY